MLSFDKTDHNLSLSASIVTSQRVMMSQHNNNSPGTESLFVSPFETASFTSACQHKG